MTTFPNSPKLLKGGLVLIDQETAMVQRIIALQYNPDSLSRTLQIKDVGAEGGDRSALGLEFNYLRDMVADENLVIVGVRGGVRF
jgi:hypothetical protein